MVFSGGKDREPIRPVGKTGSEKEIQEIQEFIGQEQSLIREEEGKKSPDPQALAEVSKNLPRLIQRTLQKIEASQVYQTFKLPGTDYLVHDRRERAQTAPPEKKEGEQIAAESKMPLQDLLLQQGKLVSAKEKDYKNYYGDPNIKEALTQQQVAKGKLLKLLTRFEKRLLERFEEGIKIIEEAKEGRVAFLKKEANQWREFFAHFLKRTVKRQIAMERLQEWVYRGLVRKESKTTIISDLALTNGHVEKFARFRLSKNAQRLAGHLAGLEPGTRLSKNDLKEQATESLEYLAIKNAQEEKSWIAAPIKGKFLGAAQTEEKIARDLGLQRGKALEKEEARETQASFVPWWHFGPFRKHPDPLRWYAVLSYAAALALLAFGIWYFL